MGKNIKIVQTVEEAVDTRGFKGFRFDNSEYWKRYYQNKLKLDNVCREYKYAKFLEKLTPQKGKVLDLASGCGFLPTEMAKLGFDVTGVDRFKDMMDEAKKYFKKNKVKVKMVKADVVKLPFDRNSFDMVTAMSIMEHLSLEEISTEMIPEIKRVILPGGKVLIHVPIKSAVTILKRWYRMFVLRDLPKWAIDDDGDVTHKVWLTIDEYQKILSKRGLVIDYLAFNFSRSNEKIWWMKVLNWLLSWLDGDFYKAGGSSLGVTFFRRLATSVVFVCHY